MLYNLHLIRGEIFILNQDLMNWLTADKTEDKNFSEGTGLLLAPISFEQPQKIEDEKISEPVQDLNINIEVVDEEEKDEKENHENNIENEIIDDEQENKNENVNESVEEITSEIHELHETVKHLQNSLEIKSDLDTEQPATETQINNTVVEINLEDAANIKKAWQEKAADFDLSLDEPPPELWTQISESDDEDEETEIEYEQGMSLQGAAYIQKQREHGKNFTERLHRTLKVRKEKAEQLREEEEENKDPHPYRTRSIIICSTMLMILGFIFLALWGIQQLTPEKLNSKAAEKFENGDYNGAMILYERAYKRYPNVLTFLTGLANSAEKAGHLQTASAAWEAYINSLPKNDTKNKRFGRRELKRLQKLQGGEEQETKIEPAPEEQEVKNEIQEPPPEPQKEQTETAKQEKEEIKEPEIIIPVNFDDFLREGNNAYNSGFYNTAVIYFLRAMELNVSDVRSYIGLARAYKAKEMYFDSKRILDEAKQKFKRNPTVEIGLKELENIH